MQTIIMTGSSYFLLERGALAIHNGVTSIIQGLALGLVSNEQLERLTQQRYLTELSVHSYAEENYVNSGLFVWEAEAVRRFFPAGGHVLVAAAGAGREMIALAGEGFKVDGFDCCAPLVEAGKTELSRHGINAKLDCVPPSSVPAGDFHYDAILVGFSGYMYIPGRKNRVRFLENLCGFLSPEAPLMVSFMEGNHGRRRLWTAKIGTSIRKLRGAEPVEEGDCFKDGFQHHFVPEQIASEMNEAGLDLAYYSGGTTYGHAVGVNLRK